METICLDTNILINFLKAREPSATALEKALINHTCCVTSITTYELLFGMYRCKKKIGEEVLLSPLKILPLDNLSAKIAAKLHADLISKNQDIGIKDILIASICLRHQIPLMTENIKHFIRVPHLKCISAQQFLSEQNLDF
jgi:tRNA(fMet)-specific endonuclease VapC